MQDFVYFWVLVLIQRCLLPLSLEISLNILSISEPPREEVNLTVLYVLPMGIYTGKRDFLPFPFSATMLISNRGLGHQTFMDLDETWHAYS